MPSIAEAQVAAAYAFGLKCIQGVVSENDAISLLVERHGMNRSSAKDYVDALRHMVNAETFKRTINVGAARFYLQNIYNDLGVATAERALVALDAHIDYYASVSKSSSPSLRLVASEFRQFLERQIEQPTANFDEQVEEWMSKASSVRARNFPPPGFKPHKFKTEVAMFARSAVVVAEVLLRAGGKCENCGNDAPFIRAKDGMPFLEVHHKVRLADGGEDTVANAIAVCPNCHRMLHYG